MKCSFNFVLDFDFFSLHVCICIYNVCKKRVVKGNAEILDFDSFGISIFRYYKAAWIYLIENHIRFDTRLLFDCR